MSTPGGLARPWGDRLRTWREEIQGWSREEFCEHVTATAFRTKEPRGTTLGPRLVARWESGRVQRPQGVYRRILAHMGAPLPPHPTHTRSALVLPSDVALEAATNGDDEDVDRRNFILGAAAGAAGILSEPWQRLEHVLTGRHRPDTDSLDTVQARTSDLYDLEERYPSAHVMGDSSAHLDTITALIGHTADGPERQHLISQAGAAAALTGWLAFDQGDVTRAVAYYRVAEQAASEANDAPLTACVQTYRSYLASAQGSPAEAARLLCHALDVLPRQQPAMRAWVSARLAEEHIALGEHDEAVRAFDHAFLASDFVHGEQPTWTRFFTPVRLDGMAVAGYARLHHPDMDTVADRLYRTTVSCDTKVGTIALADLAYAYLERGDVERGAALGQRSLDAIAASGTRVGYERLAVIDRAITPYRNSRAASGLRDQLAHALRVHE